jgi:transposase InsO family protein
MHTEDVELMPTIIMRDNDSNYHTGFDDVLRSAGAKIKRSTPRSPNLRAHVERFIQTLKFEALDKFVIVARRHLNHITSEFQVHYNRERPHEARGNLPPDHDGRPQVATSCRADVIRPSRLGGALSSYSRRAA